MGLIGISHLITGRSDVFERMKSAFELLYEESVECPKEKRLFLRNDPSAHRISFWKTGRGAAVEQVDHGSIPVPITTGYQLLSHVVRPGARIPEGLPPTGGLALATQDLSRSEEFWAALGFKSTGMAEGDFRLLVFQGIVGGPFYIMLMEDPSSRQIPYLDDRGWSCLSLLTSSLEKQLAQLKEMNVPQIGQPFELKVNGKNFRIAFARGPDSELLEFCELY